MPYHLANPHRDLVYSKMPTNLSVRLLLSVCATAGLEPTLLSQGSNHLTYVTTRARLSELSLINSLIPFYVTPNYKDLKVIRCM